MAHPYEQAFRQFSIAPAALSEWQRFVGDRSGLDAVIELQRLHVERIRQVISDHDVDTSGEFMMGFFVTNIPDHDLALVDLHSVSGMRHVALMDRQSAMQVTNLILRQQSDEVLH